MSAGSPATEAKEYRPPFRDRLDDIDEDFRNLRKEEDG